jgi:hypothetical protein
VDQFEVAIGGCPVAVVGADAEHVGVVQHLEQRRFTVEAHMLQGQRVVVPEHGSPAAGSREGVPLGHPVGGRRRRQHGAGPARDRRGAAAGALAGRGRERCGRGGAGHDLAGTVDDQPVDRATSVDGIQHAPVERLVGGRVGQAAVPLPEAARPDTARRGSRLGVPDRHAHGAGERQTASIKTLASNDSVTRRSILPT